IGRSHQSYQPLHQGYRLYRWMLNLRAVLTLNNRAFFFRCFRLVFEHGEEPTSATRIVMPPCSVVECSVFAICSSVATFASTTLTAHRCANSALFVHFFSGVLIK